MPIWSPTARHSAAGCRSGSSAATADLMKRFRDDRPGDICFARGTFNSHPYVMAAMNEFLRYLQTPEADALYRDLGSKYGTSGRGGSIARLPPERLPVEVANMSSIWTVCYTQPSRYNWMLQYYLRAEGLALTWTGTGRLAFSLNYTEADFAAVAGAFRRRGEGYARRRLVVGQSGAHQQDDQADRLEGDADAPIVCLAPTSHSIGLEPSRTSQLARRGIPAALRLRPHPNDAGRSRDRSIRRAAKQAAPCDRF